MHIVLIEPSFPANQKQFVRALHETGAVVTGIGERAKDSLDGDVRDWLTHYEQVGSVVDDQAVLGRLRWLDERLPVDRVEATVEAHVMAAAKCRAAMQLPGTSERTAFLCRDKTAMKEVLRAGGIPCAQSIGSSSREEIRDFATDVGFPVIVKPPSAAGAAGTYRAASPEELETVLDQAGLDHGATLAVEEFIEGHEAFYDTLCIDGAVTHDFISHYYPNVLEAMRERWISPQFIATNRVDSVEAYADVRALGARVIELLEIETSATHMEWFFGPKGLKFSEIACRPPGVRAWDLYNVGNDVDLYRQWAESVCHGKTSQVVSRRLASGIINLRPNQDGVVAGYDGVELLEKDYRGWIIDHRLPVAGTPTQPVADGYMANAWIRMAHPDFDELRRMFDDIGQRVKMRAE